MTVKRRKAYILFLGILLLSILAGIWVKTEKTEAAALIDGVYSIPVSLWHASKEEASMGNKSLYQTGKLVVSKGKAVLYLKFSSMEYSNMTGYLMQLDLIDNITFNEFNYPDKYTLNPSEVISVYGVVDEFNSAKSTDINCAGKNYPKVVAVPVTAGQEYTWAHVYVPVMGSLGFGDQVCRIKLSFGSLKEMTEEEKTLWTEFETEEENSQDGNTKEDTNNTGSSTGNGNNGSGNNDGSNGSNSNESGDDSNSSSDNKTENTAGNTNNNSAQNNTNDNNGTGTTGSGNGTGNTADNEADTSVGTTRIDKSVLNNKLAEANTLLKKTEEYTQASLSKLQVALKTADKVMESTQATQSMVDAQVKTLQEAIEAVVKKASKVLDKDNLEDGKYSVYIDLWHASSDKASMGNPAFNHEAMLTVDKGIYTMEISTRPMTVGTLTACLQTLQIKQADGSYLYADITARNNEGNQPSIFEFQLPSKEEYIDVMIDPKVEVMGDDPLPARLKISWDSLTALSDNAVIKENTKEIATGLKSDSADLTDQATGIRVTAQANVLDNDSKLTVTTIETGNEYEAAAQLLAETGEVFQLYNITLTSATGTEIKPSGMVKVCIPIPEDFNIDKTAVYRIDGTAKTLIAGEVDSGYYVFETSRLGLYALVEGKETAGSTVKTRDSEQSLGQEMDTRTGAGNEAVQPSLEAAGSDAAVINPADTELTLGNKLAVMLLGFSMLSSVVVTAFVIHIILQSANGKRRYHESTEK